MDLLQWFMNLLINVAGSCIIVSNKELVEELQKPIIIKFNKPKIHSPFIDII